MPIFTQDDSPGPDGPKVHLLRYDSTGLAGKRLRLITAVKSRDVVYE